MSSNVEDILQATINGTEYSDVPQSRVEDLLLQLKEKIEENSCGLSYKIDEETEIGTWGNKKLYQITKKIQIPPKGETMSIVIDEHALRIDKIVDIRGSIFRNGIIAEPLPFVSTVNVNKQISLYMERNIGISINIKSGSNIDYEFYDAYVTIRYTKY